MNLRKSFLCFMIIVILAVLAGCKAEEAKKSGDSNADNERITVAVSIVPQETFVKAVSGDLADVITMVPPGYSPANYQPTPKQMTEFSKSKVYFSIGVPTEKSNILPKAEDLNNEMKIVSLADKVGEVHPHRHFGKEKNHKVDPHIWLSPNRVKVMIETIRDELIKLDKDNESIYQKNAEDYISRLDELHESIKEILDEFKGQSFIIYHPAFGYFADDYGLKMIAIEGEGKKATSKGLQEVIDIAKKEKIKFVFYQEEFDSQQAETVAEEIGGVTLKVAPLAANYIDNLKQIADKFKEALK